MSYLKQLWRRGRSGGTPMSPERFQHMEDGIEEQSDRLDVVEANKLDQAAGDARYPRKGDLDSRQLTSEKNAPNGYAGLDADAQVPFAHLPPALRPVATTDLAAWLASFTAPMATTQPYREPTPQEAADAVLGIERLALDGANVGTLLSALGFTVSTGYDSVSKRPYVLAASENTTGRAWGAYLIDLSQPIQLMIQSPHPVADQYSELMALDHWRKTPGAVLLMAGAHRDATGVQQGGYAIADVCKQVGSMFHQVATAYAARNVPGVQWHGFADASAPGLDKIVATGSGNAGPTSVRVAKELADAGFVVGRGWDSSGSGTGLIGLTNVHGDDMLARGVAWTHVENNFTTRADPAARARAVDAVVAAQPEVAGVARMLADAKSGQFPRPVGSANTAGASMYPSRSDHIHAERPVTLDRITSLEAAPPAHAARHAAGGADPLALADLGNFTGAQVGQVVSVDQVGAGGKATFGLLGQIARQPARVVDLSRSPGVDPTGATTSDSGITALLASASPSAPLVITVPPGTYKFASPWPRVDPTAVSFVGLSPGACVFDFTALQVGQTAVSVYADSQVYSRWTPFSNLKFLGPATKATCFTFGGTNRWAPFLTFRNVEISQFDTQIVYGANTWLHVWESCSFHNWQTWCIDSPSVSNYGENMQFRGCEFFNGGGVLRQRCYTAGFTFTTCSFDYCRGRFLDIDTGTVNYVSCHFEGNDATTGIVAGINEAFYITTGTSAGPTVAFDGGVIVPRWSSRARIITTAGAGQARLIVRGPTVYTGGPTGEFTPTVLVADDATNPATSPSKIVIDGAPTTDPTVPVTYPGAAQVRIPGQDTVFGPAPSRVLASAPGVSRDFDFSSVVSGAATRRWSLRATSDPETGAEAGSLLQLVARYDTGSFKYVMWTAQRAAGVLNWGRSFIPSTVVTTVTVNQAVNIDAHTGNQQDIALSANVTSMTINTFAQGETLTITLIQDATGGRTYVWPANCKFAGGVAPSDTTANKRTSVTFKYDSGSWWEINRAVGVG